MKKINIEVSELVAIVMQRMIVEEIEKQEEWSHDDNNQMAKTRFKIIAELEELKNELEKEGIHKYQH